MAAYAVHKVREAGSALDGVGTEARAIVFDAAGAHVAAAASRRMEQSAGDLPNGRLAAGMDEWEQSLTGIHQACTAAFDDRSAASRSS